MAPACLATTPHNHPLQPRLPIIATPASVENLDAKSRIFVFTPTYNVQHGDFLRTTAFNSAEGFRVFSPTSACDNMHVIAKVMHGAAKHRIPARALPICPTGI